MIFAVPQPCHPERSRSVRSKAPAQSKDPISIAYINQPGEAFLHVHSLVPRFSKSGSFGPIPPSTRNALPFLDSNGLARGDVRELLDLPARPLDLDRVGFLFRPQPKRQHQFTSRKITRPRPHHLPLLVSPSRNAHHRANPIAIRFRP